MSKKPADTAAAQAAEPAPLPTHGGVYHYEPVTKTMKAVEGGPPAETPAADAAATPNATTGEPA